MALLQKALLSFIRRLATRPTIPGSHCCHHGLKHHRNRKRGLLAPGMHPAASQVPGGDGQAGGADRSPYSMLRTQGTLRWIAGLARLVEGR